MREIRLSGSEGGGAEFNRLSLPLSSRHTPALRLSAVSFGWGQPPIRRRLAVAFLPTEEGEAWVGCGGAPPEGVVNSPPRRAWRRRHEWQKKRQKAGAILGPRCRQDAGGTDARPAAGPPRCASRTTPLRLSTVRGDEMRIVGSGAPTGNPGTWGHATGGEARTAPRSCTGGDARATSWCHGHCGHARARAGCPWHSGRDARATSAHTSPYRISAVSCEKITR